MSSNLRPLSAHFPLTTAALTIALVACSGAGTSGTSSVSSAIGTGTDGGTVDLAGCLTSYVDCLRADGADAGTCKEAVHQCLRPSDRDGKGGHHHGGGDGDCDGDHDGGPPPPPPSGSAAPPPPPPSGSAPPPPNGGDAPPPPPPDGDHDGAGPDGGPRACFDALDTCAAGTDATATCVDAAVTCLAAFPPPPPPRGGDGDGPRR